MRKTNAKGCLSSERKREREREREIGGKKERERVRKGEGEGGERGSSEWARVQNRSQLF